MPSSEKIQALLFDLGGVVVEIDFERALQAWRQWSRVSIGEMRNRFGMDEAYEKHERGEIEAAEYFTHLRSLLELDASDSQIASGWNAIFLDEIAETVDYIMAVRDRLPCYAFSNSNPTHRDFWMAAYPRAVASFHRIFVSSDLGLRKPEPAAFESIAEATGISLDAMLFFDDTEANILGAQALGMHTIHVKGHSDVRRALADIGVL